MNRFFLRAFSLAMSGVMLMIAIPTAHAQQPAQPAAGQWQKFGQKPVTQAPAPGQNPLINQTEKDGSNPRTVWELTVPQRPDDRSAILSYQRLAYGFSLIQDDPVKVREFMQAYQNQVKPGPNAWHNAETLVLAYTNGRAQTDSIGNVELTPDQIRIITTPEEIRQYYGLDPIKDFHPMDWGHDPIGRGFPHVERRGDLMRNFSAYEKKIRQIYTTDPTTAELIIKTARECVGSIGNTTTCKDMYAKDLGFAQRNYGASSMGENESYAKGTNVPGARATFFFVAGIGWKGMGWECFGNPLEPFTAINLYAMVAVAIPTPSALTCTLSPTEVILHSRAEVAKFTLQVIPEQKPEDMSIDWLLNNQPFAGNVMQAEVSGSQVQLGDWNDVIAHVAVGRKEVTCRARVSLQFPQITRVPPPPAVVTPPPTPTYIHNPPPEKHHHGCGKGCKALIVVGIIGAAAGAGFALRGHGKEKSPGTPAGAGVSF